MEYVYAAMLLHKAGKPIDEGNVGKILQAVGIEADPARVKALVAAVSEIDIAVAIKSAPTFMSATVPAAPAEPAAPKTEDKPKKEEKKEEAKEEEALEGLGALFG
jgi:large subunit ribosomal protein L12